MDPIEIIVTRADSTPTSSSTALNKIANSSTAEASISQPNLEIHFNALNKPMPNAKLSQTIRNNRRHQPNQPKIITAVAAADGVTTSSSSNYNTPATSSSDESKRPLLPSSPSSASLQLTKKLKILPSAKTSNATATTLNAPSKTTATSVPNRAHPPSNFPQIYFLSSLLYLLVFVSIVCCACLYGRILYNTFACVCGCSYTTPSIHPYTCPRCEAKKKTNRTEEEE